jgi:hypothetical protein
MKTYTMKVKGTTSVLKPVDNKKTLYINRDEFYQWFCEDRMELNTYEIWGEVLLQELWQLGKTSFSDKDMLQEIGFSSIPVRLVLNPEDIDDLSEITDGFIVFEDNQKYNLEFKEVE